MRRVLDHGRWIVVTLLLLGGLVVASLCRGDDSERAARLGRLQTFVAATQKKAAQRDPPRPFCDLVPAYDEPAQLGIAAATALLGDLRHAGEMLAQLEEPDAHEQRAVLRPCLEPIVQALRRAAGGRGSARELGAWSSRVLQVAFLEAGDRAAWSEQVEIWLVMRAVRERPRLPSFAPVSPFWTEQSFTSLDAAALRLLASALAHVDANTALTADPPMALANWVEPLLVRPRPTSIRRRLAAWRHGFDTHERELVAAGELLAALPELADGDCVWDVREQQWQRFFAAVRSGAGATLPRSLEGLRQHERSLRRDLAQLRLLRLCIAWQLGEPLPAVLDPFTLTPFVVETNGDAATFRSPSTQPDLVRGATRLGAAEQR
jgi:hypothetical protein